METLAIDSVRWFLDNTVVDHHPEFADMDNPEGALYDWMIFVEAVTPDGRRFHHSMAFPPNDEDKADLLVSQIKAAGKINTIYWVETYEVYGSPAWQLADNQRHLAWQSNPNTAGTVRDI
jgi:hypothetical protein